MLAHVVRILIGLSRLTTIDDNRDLFEQYGKYVADGRLFWCRTASHGS